MNVEYLRGLLDKFMYRDTFDIMRQVRVTESYVDDFEQQLVAEGISCHLAQYGKQLYAHRDDRSQKLTSDLRLCCRPDVDVRTNDYVIVHRQGDEWHLIAGEVFRYPTHLEVSCRRRKEAGQT